MYDQRSEDAGQKIFFACGGHRPLVAAVSVSAGACCQSIVVRLLRTAVFISYWLETDGSKFSSPAAGVTLLSTVGAEHAW